MTLEFQQWRLAFVGSLINILCFQMRLSGGARLDPRATHAESLVAHVFNAYVPGIR